MVRNDSTSHQSSRSASNRPSRRAFLAGGSALALGMGLAGCSGDGGESPADGETDSQSDSGGTTTGGTEPEKPDSLTVRAWGGVWEESMRTSLAEPFTEETGIDVEFDNTEASVMQGQIRTALNQDRAPPINVDWGLVTLTHSSYRRELLEPIDPETLENAGNLRERGTPDVEGETWPYVNLYSYTYPVCYNTDQLEEVQGDTTPVESWETLWDSAYEDAVGIYERGDGLIPILAELTDTELGAADEMEPVWDELEGLQPNVGVIGDDTNLTQAIQEGQVAYNAAFLPTNLVSAKNDGEPFDWTVPDEGALARMDSLSVPRGQSESERYWAKQYVDYSLRTDVMQNWMEALQVPMLNSEVEPPEWMQGDPAFPTSSEDFDELLFTDLDVYAEHSSSWFERFDQLMGS